MCPPLRKLFVPLDGVLRAWV